MKKPEPPVLKSRKEEWIRYAKNLELYQTALYLRATNRANIKRAQEAVRALYTGGTCELASDERDVVFNLLLEWEMRLMEDG